MKRHALLLTALIAIRTLSAETLAPGDHSLAIELGENGTVESLTVNRRPSIAAASAAGLSVLDVKAGTSTAVPISAGRERVANITDHSLRVTARTEALADRIVISGVVEDTRGTDDRAVDIVLRLPFASAVWWSGISARVGPDEEARPSAKRRTQEQVVEGAAVLEPLEDGGLAQNFMPIGCVTSTDETAGLAVALPPDAPCRFRFAYLREQGCIELTFLFGLSPVATGELKSRAPFKCEVFQVDGRWAMRDAWRRYWQMHPASFQRRTEACGLWLVSLPALDQVPDPHNYAFWQTTRPNDTERGVQLGMEVYPYTVVGQREIGYMKDKVGSHEDVERALTAKPATTKRSRYTWEEVKTLVETSGLHGANGRWLYRLRTTDWAGASVSFPTNPSPFLPSTKERPSVAEHTFAEGQRDIAAHPKLAGSFVDSLASWGSYENYRRDHFAAARSPLTHDSKGRVSIQNWMPHVDYLRELRRRITPKLIFGNGPKPGRAFCAFELDVFGVEFTPRDLEERMQMDFVRCVAGPKPVCGLFDYEPHKGLPRAQMEDYVNRCTALGFTPESRHWKWPEYKDRDADLMTTFLPIIRQIHRAGWQPVTHARTDQASVWIERFGNGDELYFSLFNPTSKTVTVRVSADESALKSTSGSWQELVTQSAVKLSAPVAVPAKSVRVLQRTNADPSTGR